MERENKQLGIIYQTAEGKIIIGLDFYSIPGYFEGRARRLKSRGCDILYSNPNLSAEESAVLFNQIVKNGRYLDENGLADISTRLEKVKERREA